jgi:hypothetical protein
LSPPPKSRTTRRRGDGKDEDGLGVGGVYNLGLFARDGEAVIAGNHAPASYDDIFDLLR